MSGLVDADKCQVKVIAFADGLVIKVHDVGLVVRSRAEAEQLVGVILQGVEAVFGKVSR